MFGLDSVNLYLEYFQPFPVEGQKAPLFYFPEKVELLIQCLRHHNIFHFKGPAAAPSLNYYIIDARDKVEKYLSLW